METRLIKTGIICGFLTVIIYPSMLLLDIPLNFTLMLGCSFGIFFMVASIGLYQFIAINKKSVSLQLGVLFNIIGCSVVVMMITIQLALVSIKGKSPASIPVESFNYLFQMINIIQLALDVVWDIFVSLGSILIAINMLTHPKLGRIVGITGIIIGAGLLVLNISTFPVPPDEAGLIDLGPVAALWYLTVTIMMSLGMKWVHEKLPYVNQ